MKPLRLGIIGFGQMGQRIETLAKEQGHSVTAIFKGDFPFSKDYLAQSKGRVDVWIDFSHPRSSPEVIKAIAELDLKLVVGTTGWYEQTEELKTLVESSKAGVVWSSNFSVGVYAFHKIVEYAAGMMSRLSEYDVTLHETHHRFKKDAPSGTAMTLSDLILNVYKSAGMKSKTETNVPGSGLPDKDTLYITSSRVGRVVGQHEVIFDSEYDTIHLQHQARSRTGFAYGALLAAQWISDKDGFFGMDELINDVLGAQS